MSRVTIPGRMVDISFRTEASADLAGIHAQSVEQFGEDKAQDYLSGLQAAITGLADYPLMGAVYPGLRPPIRFLAFRRHHVLYDFDGTTVVIVRILHHAMDARGRV